jgi:hypothetical protein
MYNFWTFLAQIDLSKNTQTWLPLPNFPIPKFIRSTKKRLSICTTSEFFYPKVASSNFKSVYPKEHERKYNIPNFPIQNPYKVSSKFIHSKIYNFCTFLIQALHNRVPNLSAQKQISIFRPSEFFLFKIHIHRIPNQSTQKHLNSTVFYSKST